MMRNGRKIGQEEMYYSYHTALITTYHISYIFLLLDIKRAVF